MTIAVNRFGAELKLWRNRRRLTQLELAMLSGYSQRHISFLESQRSQPSRSAVLVLAEALDVPLPARNGLLHAAGFAPAFTSEPLTSRHLRFAVGALESVLVGHRPFPAIIVDRAWNSYAANANAMALFQMFLDEPLSAQTTGPVNLIDLCLRYDGLRPHIVDWPQFIHAMLSQLRQQQGFDGSGDELEHLIRRVTDDREYADWARRHAPSQTSASAATLCFSRDGTSVRLFTLVSVFATPHDSTLSDLRVETFCPADEETRRRLEVIERDLGAAQEASREGQQRPAAVHWHTGNPPGRH